MNNGGRSRCISIVRQIVTKENRRISKSCSRELIFVRENFSKPAVNLVSAPCLRAEDMKVKRYCYLYIYYLYIGCIISARTLTLYINTSFVDCSTPLWYSIYSDLEMYKRVCVFYFSSQISKYVLIRFLSSLLDHNRQNTTHRCLNTRIPCRCSCASRSLGSQS